MFAKKKIDFAGIKTLAFPFSLDEIKKISLLLLIHHPLLCSLISAENVRFLQQKDMGNEIVSGKFSAMLKDIFGKSFPEEEYFKLDREQSINIKSILPAVKMK